MSEIANILLNTKEPSYFGKRLDGLLIGTVTNNYEKKLPDQVEVELPIGGSSKTMKIWARNLYLSAGNDYGLYNKPEIGDVAVVGFIDGNTARAVVLGYLYKKAAQMLTDCVKEKNPIKKYKTPQGSELIFENKNNKALVTLTTQGKQQLILNEEAEEIELTAAKSHMKVQGKTGNILIESEKSLQLKVGQSQINLNKDGTVEINCMTLKVTGKPNIKIEGNTLTANGTQVDIKGTAGVKLESSVMVQAKAQIVKLG